MASQKTKQPYILGLDVGPNSIGWAIVECIKEEPKDADEHKGIYAGYAPTRLKALNSRVFLEMVDAKTKIPNNQKRRVARGARNRIRFYQKQRNKLIQLLQQHDLLPEGLQSQPERHLNQIDRAFAERILGKSWDKNWSVTDKAHATPYAMRHYALEQKLEPYELGRLFLHLRQRRGYFSNRGAQYIELFKYLARQAPEDDKDSVDKETGKVLEGIGQLKELLNHRTLGQYIWQIALKTQSLPQRISLHTNQKEKSVKGKTVLESMRLYATREMYEKEFETITASQRQYHPDIPAGKIEKLIYYQRPLDLQKGRVGKCNIYSDKKRCHMARLIFQEFRTRQVINNIKVASPGTKELQSLTPEQRQKLFDICQSASGDAEVNAQFKISWKEISRIIGAKCNYEKTGSQDTANGVPVNKTAFAIAEIIGEKWERLCGEQTSEALVEDLLTIHSKKALYKRLVNHWKFSSDEALKLCCDCPLDNAYAGHSSKALKEINTHLEAGLTYYHAVKEMGKQDSITQTHHYDKQKSRLEPYDVDNIANPIVQKALFEIRRVVNSIIKRYGLPEIIRIELARDMKASKKHRSDIQSEQNKNRKRNEEVEAELLKYYQQGNPNIALLSTKSGRRRVDPEDRKKYKMWHDEQGEQCPYCKRPIGINELFDGQAEIEHILPYTGFSQNYQNTVISCKTCNAEKGKRTPYEAWGGDSQRWGAIEQFAEKHFTGKLFPKKRRLLSKKPAREHIEELEDFVERQLNDTAYIARAAKSLLLKYGVPVDVNNGAATAQLRRCWGLNKLLPARPDSSVYQEKDGILSYKEAQAKKVRDDHRHHAVDAFVVAMTDRKMLQLMVKAHQAEQDGATPGRQNRCLQLPDSWQSKGALRKVVRDKVHRSVVSNMIKRKVYGALHEETLFGRSFYSCQSAPDVRLKTLKDVRKLTQNQPCSTDGWVPDGPLKDYLNRWASENVALGGEERQLPVWNGKPLAQIKYHVPCATTRKPLISIVKMLKSLDEDWNPGKKTWIAEPSIHNALYQWIRTHGLSQATDKEVEQKLKDHPPVVIDREGNSTGRTIKKVVTAEVWSDSLVRLNKNNTYAKKGSNHHLVIFNNGLEGKDRKLQVKMVSMIEAAGRAQSGQPVVDKTPPKDWEGTWHYQIHLCNQDMVRWEDDSVFNGENENLHPSFKNTPYFRVQKMSAKDKKSIDIFFRHHSVSGTEDKWGLIQVQSLKKVTCAVAHIGNLGFYDDQAHD